MARRSEHYALHLRVSTGLDALLSGVASARARTGTTRGFARYWAEKVASPLVFHSGLLFTLPTETTNDFPLYLTFDFFQRAGEGAATGNLIFMNVLVSRLFCGMNCNVILVGGFENTRRYSRPIGA